MSKKSKNNKHNQKEINSPLSYNSPKRSFFLGIIGLAISLTSLPNKGLIFITYPLLILSILVILLAFWQFYNKTKN